ncbi:MAG: hypothetical protein N2504_03565 [candidate division WOR-3 bacterium]|nr:hypothetical protein [candidate division WOR-3 bacterium]MCX7947645.1 hypothetical protein [candidate division WOR-3 bacterium]MDW8150523.1 hypothetical protein [candidate division WOR-3 bacterium]
MFLTFVLNFPSNIKPVEIENVELIPKIGNKIEDIYFYDQTGKRFSFSELTKDSIPILLIPVYYTCEVVCNNTLLYTIEQLKKLNDLKIGKDYKLIAFSFDYNNTILDATNKFKYCKVIGGNDENCKFLVSDSLNVEKLLSGIGFKLKRLKNGEIVHPVSIIVLTPSGKISRYLLGLSFLGKDIRLAIWEAQLEKIESITDIGKSAILFCFHYDPKGGKYAFNFAKIAGIIGILTLASIFAYIFLTPTKKEKIQAINKEEH